MFGFNIIKELPPTLTSLQVKYAKRYHMDKLLNELRIGWGLKLFSDHSRGFYISFGVTMAELAVISGMAKKRTKIDVLKNERKEAIIIVRKLLEQNSKK